MAISESAKRNVLFVVLIILLVGLIVLLFLISKQIKQAREDVGKVESATETPTATASASQSSNVNVTYSLTASETATDENLQTAKDVANKFMQAKEERSYDQATPYMTDELKGKWNQESFSGTSSPSMDRFEISTSSKSDDNTYIISVTSYWKLAGEDDQKINYNLELTKNDLDFLVNKFDQI